MQSLEPLFSERLIPCPQKMELYEDICDCGKMEFIELKTNISDAENIIKNAFQTSFKADPVRKKQAGIAVPEEGYFLEIQTTHISITAGDRAGVMNACKTLRQLAEAKRGGEGVVFQTLKIEDYPARKFRGIHFCVFPETTLAELEKNLRLAALHKLNYAVIEFWGNFPFESHPEFGWADRKLDRNELKRILQVCRDNGLTPIPQFNILGHATASRVITGKNAFVYRLPELKSCSSRLFGAGV